MDGVLSEFFRQSIVGDVLSVWYFDWFVLSFRLHVPVFVLILIRSSFALLSFLPLRFQRVCIEHVWQRMFALRARIVLSRWYAVHVVTTCFWRLRPFRVIVYFSCVIAFVCRRHVAAAVSARVCLQRVVASAARPVVSRRVRQSACTITLVWVVCVCVWFLI